MKKYIASSLVALALTVSSMNAATINVGVNDLILGFRASSGTGAASNLEVNLGNITNFTNLSVGQTSNFSSRLSSADLTATYGDFNRTTLFFAVAGTAGNSALGSNGALANTVWRTSTTGSLLADTTTTTAINNFKASDANLAGQTSAISGLYSGAPASLNGKASTGNSDFAAVLDTATAGSFSKQGLTGSTLDFGSGLNFASASAASGTKNLFLYQVQPLDLVSGSTTQGVNQLGFFTFNTATAGLVYTSTSTVSAVPEPSTYAALAGVAVLGLAVSRRRSAVRA